MALVMTRSSAPSGVGHAGRLRHAVADGLAAAEDGLVAVGGEVALDLGGRGRYRPGGSGRRWSGRRGRRSAGGRCGIRRSRTRSALAAQARRRPRRGSSACRRPAPLKPIDALRAAEGDQVDLALVARARSARRCRPGCPGACRRRRCAVEAQRPVDLEEVVVRADLDRAVAGVARPQRSRGAVRRSARSLRPAGGSAAGARSTSPAAALGTGCRQALVRRSGRGR